MPITPKRWDRAMEGGIDDVGIGVLFGLNTYRYDFIGLLMHVEHLEAKFGCRSPYNQCAAYLFGG